MEFRRVLFRSADAIAPIPGLTAPREVPPGVVVVTPPAPSRDDLLRFQLIGAVPGILAGLALWLSAWIPLQRGLRIATPDGEIERRSVVRKLWIYLVVLVSALAVLLSATIALANVVERILGTPDREEFRNIQHDLGFPVTNGLVFATVWFFYRPRGSGGRRARNRGRARRDDPPPLHLSHRGDRARDARR